MSEAPHIHGLPSPEGLTMLDGLLDDIDVHPGAQDTVFIDIPERPGWSVRCSTDIPYEELSAWRKGAHDPSLDGGMNQRTLACASLVAKTVAILLNDEEVTIDGKPVTLVSPALHQKLGVNDPSSAVRKLFRRDAHLIAASRALLVEAGYGAEVTPTRR